MNTRHATLALLLSATVAAAAHAEPTARDTLTGKPGSIERGRYLARVGGCNDCHTPGYAQSGGRVPEQQWLTGDAVGWRGPWGTTYPANLRLSFATMSEAQWIAFARGAQTRPPMPWFNLRAMSTDDLRALYRFVQHLGPAGSPAPAFVPPGQPATGPVIRFPE